ncbi:MAG: TolC family outer membrane protein [Thiogranum sp.]|nr:TolC family outer membrane protein [Thiogranum sp.]
MKKILLAGLLLCAMQTHAADLVTVYRDAAATNPQLAAAAARLEAVREARPQARAGLLPNIDLLGTLDRTRRKSVNPSQPATYSTDKLASINLNQPLFRYDRWIQLQQADSRIATAAAEYEAARQELMLLVAERYFGILEAQANLEFAQAEKSAIGRQLEQAQQRFEVGLIAITDVKAAQARYDLSVSQEIRAASDVQQARDALHQVTGRFYPQIAPLRDDLLLARPQPDSADSWIEGAREQNLRVLAAAAAAETARQEMRVQRSGHLPTLDFNASASYFDNNFGGIAPVERQDSSIGLELNLPIYEGGTVTSQTREARHRFQESTELLQEQVRQAEFQTRDAFRGILTDIAQINALEASLQSTEIAVEAEQAGFEVGTRTIVDVLNAQREYHSALFNFAAARYQYVLDQLRLKNAAGILSPDDLHEVNDVLGPEPAVDD